MEKFTKHGCPFFPLLKDVIKLPCLSAHAIVVHNKTKTNCFFGIF